VSSIKQTGMKIGFSELNKMNGILFN